MRKITKQAIYSLIHSKTFKASNTEVLHKAMLKNGKFPKGDHFTVLELFGNEIAAMDSKDGATWITSAGWKSNTTKERLNAIDNVSIQQKKGKWYLNGEEWNGEWTKVTLA